ncbi:hypothetical protein [Halotia branconii]|uniref:Uncharacterized protein n=1 Tax=Halotia branconii CENA392 TaxID=1539056 RepID=A0AAJ6P9Q4_9CYAN|nr:hypothetical protein [Halotia branconii]WGV25976.1 hypothetical protein QI031_00170 [Halotia branconii CENA392]
MNIEIYNQVGELVEVKAIENFIITPNITQFTIGMMTNESYAKLNASANQELKIRLEIAVTRLELKPEITAIDLQLLKGIWDGLIQGMPEGILNNDDKQSWISLCNINNMPFTFNDDYTMQIINDYNV